MKSLFYALGLLSAANGAAAEFLPVEPTYVLKGGSIYECSIEEFSSASIDDRATWFFDGNEWWSPYALSLSVPTTAEVGETLVVEFKADREASPVKYALKVEARLSDGSGEENIAFSGALGEGYLTLSQKVAGSEHPGRLVWSDPSGSLFYSAFLYCARVGSI